MMSQFIASAVAPSTRKVYAAGVRRFRAFCASQDYSPLPASELSIRLFCTAQAARVTYSTISTYVSAIRMYHLQHGLPDPTAQAPLLALLLQGIRRSAGHQKRKPRKPITAEMLARLKTATKSGARDSSQAILYWAAFSLAFHAFLRVSEYTAKSRSATSSATLRASHLTLHHSSLTTHLPKSKTSQYHAPPPIHVGATNTPTCPVKAMRRFLSRRTASARKPLFTFADGSYLTPKLVSTTLKQALQSAGFNSTRYSTHSLRIGAATSASAAGMSGHTIQHLGRWKSDAFKLYIRPTKQFLRQSSRALAASS